MVPGIPFTQPVPSVFEFPQLLATLTSVSGTHQIPSCLRAFAMFSLPETLSPQVIYIVPSLISFYLFNKLLLHAYYVPDLLPSSSEQASIKGWLTDG